ncbi:Protein FAR1-RELATED SEQUENCE [Abeliophyllum distichum]|uniref:Protein FAR1-RELATED SEQUENCE n=1 Tax=Abeliophyllum distichum TaxID=126358 RepID=A0ABD1QVN1_9LAMI
MEHQMVHINTKKIFLLFQTKVDQSNYYMYSKKSGSDDVKTKNAKVSVCEDPSTGISDGGSSSTSLMSRHGMLAHKSSLLVDDAALTDARTIFLMGEFESLHVQIKEIDDGGNVAFYRSRSKSREESHAIHDPCLVRAKGCGKRLKSSKEKSLSKNTRQCDGCGQHGHNKRT